MASQQNISVANKTEKPWKLSCELHAKKLLRVLNDTRSCEHLCDAVVIIDGEEILVQKNILSAASEYFRSIFTYEHSKAVDKGDTNERNMRKVCIDLTTNEITADTFRSILDYIYTSETTLCSENIQDILQAADVFLLTDLKLACCQYLEECIAPHNVIGIREFAARYSCPWIHSKSTRYLDKHFRDVSFSEEFQNLSFSSVCEILTRNTIMVRVEEDIVEAILRWVNFDLPERKSQLHPAVMRCVRASLVKDQSVARLLEDYPLLHDEGSLVQCIQQLRRTAQEPQCRGSSPVIILCGGKGQPTDPLESADIRACVRFAKYRRFHESATDTWMEMSPMQVPRTGHGFTEAEGFLYAVGGIDGNHQILKNGEKYDPLQNTWSPIAPMEHSRSRFGLVTIDDNIYAIGGSSDLSSQPLTTMEVYNIFTNRWRTLPDVPIKRLWSSYASLNKKIYVIAGHTSTKFYEAVECFNTKTETWVSVCPMRERRCDARAVAADGDIFVVGGYRKIECPGMMHSDSSFKFCGTEVYTPEVDCWVSLTTPNGAQALCTMQDNSYVEGAVACQDEVLVVGNLDVGNGSHCVRAYNRQTRKWRCVMATQPTNQWSYQVAMLLMPNATLSKIQWDQGQLYFRDIKQT
ncbi:gigaxonin-like [Gigantopelta aegis]|uniref:gigaxonin-like n=1 Tax=Gigantopelta aegis TaxID=1735272 RepID=UPI001B88DC71|nr:gigaxonin-like [Gigantopelta aegis]